VSFEIPQALDGRPLLCGVVSVATFVTELGQASQNELVEEPMVRALETAAALIVRMTSRSDMSSEVLRVLSYTEKHPGLAFVQPVEP
jgi:hypothetical protein